MKTAQFTQVLRQAGEFLQGSCGSGASDSLLRLADALDLAATKPVKYVAQRLFSHAEARGGVLDLGRGVVEQLERLRALLIAAGSSKFAQDCDAILGLVGPAAGFKIPIEEAAREVLQAAPKKAASKKSDMQPDVPKLGAAAVLRFADRLATAVLDRASFDQVVGELSEPSACSTVDLKRIADQFLGSPRSYRTRKDILKSLELRRRQEETQALREKALSKISI